MWRRREKCSPDSTSSLSKIIIQILSNSENKDVISLHLKTLFDGIVALEFKDENITKIVLQRERSRRTL